MRLKGNTIFITGGGSGIGRGFAEAFHKLGNKVIIGAKSGVMTDIPDGETWLWIPAQPDRMAKKQMLALQQLPELLRRVAALERKQDEK